jgi:hypothetical protein
MMSLAGHQSRKHKSTTKQSVGPIIFDNRAENRWKGGAVPPLRKSQIYEQEFWPKRLIGVSDERRKKQQLNFCLGLF